MKHVIFICILFALLLSACGNSQPAPAITATSLPTNTSIPTSTETPTPSVPMIEVDGLQIPDLKVSNPELLGTTPDSSIAQYVNAMQTLGIEVDASKVYEAVGDLNNFQVKTDANGNQVVEFTYTVSKDGINYSMAFIYDNQNNLWREKNLKDSGIIGLEITGKDDTSSLNYLRLIHENASFIFTGGKLLERTSSHMINGEKILALADDGQQIYIHGGFYPKDEYPVLSTNAEKEQFVDQRLRWMLSLVRKTDKGFAPTTINLVNEGNSFSGIDSNFILYELYGKQEFSKIYVKAYEIAKEMGLEVGKDVRFSISDAYVFGNIKEGGVADTLERTMQEISAELNIPREQVQLDFAGQLRIDFGATQIKQRRAPTSDQFINAINRFRSIIGSKNRLFITEIRVANQNSPEDVIKTLSPLLEAGLSTGQIDGLMFEAPFRTLEENDPSYNSENITLFEKGLNKGPFYYYLIYLLNTHGY